MVLKAHNERLSCLALHLIPHMSSMTPLVLFPVVFVQMVVQNPTVLTYREAWSGVDRQSEGRLHEIFLLLLFFRHPLSPTASTYIVLVHIIFSSSFLIMVVHLVQDTSTDLAQWVLMVVMFTAIIVVAKDASLKKDIGWGSDGNKWSSVCALRANILKFSFLPYERRITLLLRDQPRFFSTATSLRK